jgi:hypothetical protein
MVCRPFKWIVEEEIKIRTAGSYLREELLGDALKAIQTSKET